MNWHAIVVQTEIPWKCAADLVNEYLRLFRYSNEWAVMKADLTELLKCEGHHLDLLIGPDPGEAAYMEMGSCHEAALRILYVSKATMPKQTGLENVRWQTSASISAI